MLFRNTYPISMSRFLQKWVNSEKLRRAKGTTHGQCHLPIVPNGLDACVFRSCDRISISESIVLMKPSDQISLPPPLYSITFVKFSLSPLTFSLDVFYSAANTLVNSLHAFGDHWSFYLRMFHSDLVFCFGFEWVCSDKVEIPDERKQPNTKIISQTNPSPPRGGTNVQQTNL